VAKGVRGDALDDPGLVHRLLNGVLDMRFVQMVSPIPVFRSDEVQGSDWEEPLPPRSLGGIFIFAVQCILNKCNVISDGEVANSG